MLANRRRSERRACRNFAKIQFGTGGLPRDCLITDVSDGGVKIIAEYPEIPSEFTVIFSTGAVRSGAMLVAVCASAMTPPRIIAPRVDDPRPILAIAGILLR